MACGRLSARSPRHHGKPPGCACTCAHIHVRAALHVPGAVCGEARPPVPSLLLPQATVALTTHCPRDAESVSGRLILRRGPCRWLASCYQDKISCPQSPRRVGGRAGGPPGAPAACAPDGAQAGPWPRTRRVDTSHTVGWGHGQNKHQRGRWQNPPVAVAGARRGGGMWGAWGWGVGGLRAGWLPITLPPHPHPSGLGTCRFWLGTSFPSPAPLLSGKKTTCSRSLISEPFSF